MIMVPKMDERLKKVYLHNIRIAFFFQSLGLLGIIIYRLAVRKHALTDVADLLILFLVTLVLLHSLNLRISIDAYEKYTRFPKSLLTVCLIATVFGLCLGAIQHFGSPTPSVKVTFIVGGVGFVSAYGPFFAAYLMQKKRAHEDGADDSLA